MCFPISCPIFKSSFRHAFDTCKLDVELDLTNYDRYKLEVKGRTFEVISTCHGVESVSEIDECRVWAFIRCIGISTSSTRIKKVLSEDGYRLSKYVVSHGAPKTHPAKGDSEVTPLLASCASK